ncbi:MAG: hypothetical protein P1Q69_07420 [Candidatus Thorarchaeota archaeon]|nr:hypothetical protein [Candidatus Thorarchaeota archaeon]
MARLEQSIGTSPEGGRFTMTEDALKIIEEYLSLVREYLPSSIADDIVDELRGYIVEAAEEEGAGTLSVESAKRTVSRFGAPSEVAEEYKESMLLEEHDTSHISSGGGRTTTAVSDTPKKEVRARRAVAQFFVAISLWIIATGVAGFFAGLIIAMAQLTTVFVLAIFRGFQLRRRSNSLYRRSYPEWSRLHRLFTLPLGTLPVLKNKWIVFDFVLTIIAIGVCINPWTFYVIPFFVFRLWFIVKRVRELDPILFVKRDVVLGLLTVSIFNLSVNALFFLGGMHTYMYASLFLLIGIYAGIYGFFQLIYITSVTQGLWFEKMTIRSDGEVTVESKSIPEYEYDEHGEIDRKETEPRGDPASFTRISLRAIGLGVMWSTAAVSIALLLHGFPWWSLPASMVILAIHIPGAVGLHLGNVSRAKRKGTLQWNKRETKPSLLFKLLDFPKGLFPEQSTFMLRMDLLATFLAFIFSTAYWAVADMPLAFRAVLIAFSVFSGLRFIILNNKWNNPYSTNYNRLEFVVNLVLLIAGTYLVLGAMFGTYWYYDAPFNRSVYATYFEVRYVFTNYFFTGWIFFGIYLQYAMVSRGQTLWNDEVTTSTTRKRTTPEAIEKSPTPKRKSPKETSITLTTLRQQYSQAFGMIAGWYVILSLVATFVVMLATGLFYVGVVLIVSTIMLIASLVIATLQFVWRRIRISFNPDSPTIGNRTRLESAIDAYLMAAAIIFLYTAIPEFMDIYNRYLYQFSGITLTIAQIIGAIAFVALYISPLIRLLGNITGLMRGENRASNEAMLISGSLFAISVAVFAAMNLIIQPSMGLIGVFFYDFMPIVLLIILIPVIVQAVTSQIKIGSENTVKIKPGESLPIFGGTSSKSSEGPVDEEYVPPRQ